MKPNPVAWYTLVLALFAVTAFTLHAQGPGPGGPGGGGNGMSGNMARPPGGGPPGEGGSADTLAMLLRTLNLTPAQKAQVQPILDAAAPQIRAIREEAATKTDAVVQSAETQIKPLLTPYQQQVLVSMAKNREAMRNPSRGTRQ